MNVDNQVTIIEITADYLCLVVLGDKMSIEELIEDIKSTNQSDPTQYIAVKIDNPIANKLNELTTSCNINKKYIKNILIDEGIESAQCYTYAEGYNSQSYMLMCIYEENNQYFMGYPKFELGEEEDPEIIIEGWFKKKIKKVPNGIKKNMKLITVVGTQTNILVIATKIKNKKKKQNSDEE